MENSLLIGLSRQTALQRELGVVANNIANMNTSGFKADNSVFSEYLQSAARGEQFNTRDKRVSYVQDRATWHDLSQGPLEQTGNTLDVAIDGKAFLVVQTAAGERYTRSGALQINAAGQLVTAAGDPVLGENGPITFTSSDRGIVINPDGTIRVREGVTPNTDSGRGTLRLASFDNPQLLQKSGATSFKAPDGVVPLPAPKTVRVLQGSIEKSNVRSVVEMTRMIELTRAYSDVAGILQQQGDLRRTAIEKLADVPA